MLSAKLRTPAVSVALGAAVVLTIWSVCRAAEEQKQPARDSVADDTDHKRSKDNLRRIGQALHKFHEVQKHFPTAAIYGEGEKPLLSWRVAILPYLGEEALYKQFKLDEPWDSPHNKTLSAKMPEVYAPPGKKTEESNATYYQVFSGKGTLFEGTASVAVQDVKDGTSATIMVIEAGEAVSWTKPDDLSFAPDDDLPELGGLFEDRLHFVAVDGFVYSHEKKIDPEKMRAAVTRAGREVVRLNNLGP